MTPLRFCALTAAFATFSAALLLPAPLRAQDNYEIQVYGAETVKPKTVMLELHSNFTANGFHPAPGSVYTVDGTYPTNHAEHETVEITAGVNDWAEVGFYIFTSYNPATGYHWVGDHIRPRVRAPDSWHLPVGLSLSTEVGYQRARFSPDTWTWEIRPIIDKQAGRLYVAFNPAFDRAWHGPGIRDGLVFAPNLKAGWDFSKKVNVGFEYYASYGSFAKLSAIHDQQQQFFVATDLNLDPRYEINVGIGVGATASTDHLIFKTIVGRRFSFGHHTEPPERSGTVVK